ncbi:hypothetical protein ACCO45_009706 [Purpureocillium lilacinum]|uniref:Uncharacterized protein n=1 Tax=Purpureocillium lilacinum TaxID=33203 RepID=A0ACC4DKI4_PURLI
MMSLLLTTLALVASPLLTPSSHTRAGGGNNLIQNETFPYGMQWMYPCGGIGTTTNRTYWPTTGGAVSFQPGWFRGHATAMAYVNMGFGTDGPDHGPENMSFPMVKPFQIIGPTNNPFPGTICLPQVVELAQHGASLFSCVDIIFAEPGDPRIGEVNETNCFNSTDIGFAEVYTITTKNSGSDAYVSSGAVETVRRLSWVGYLPLAVVGLWALL